MPFTKNMVMTEHAFSIDVKVENEDDAPMLSCPRCGHVQPRKLRTMCLGCKRFIPYDEARQRWDRKPRNPYLELNDLLPEEEAKEVNFKKMRRGYWEYVRAARAVVILAVIFAASYYATPYLGKAVMGEAKFAKFQRQLSVALKQTNKQIAYKTAHHK